MPIKNSGVPGKNQFNINKREKEYRLQHQECQSREVMVDYYTPARGIMGLIGPEGVLMLPEGRRPLGRGPRDVV